MADFEEDSVFTEGVRAFEATDPARFDVLNDTIKPLVDRTRYLYDNMGQGGGAAVEWIVADGSNVGINDLTPGTMYILDTRNEATLGVVVTGGLSVAVGSEFHFVCAGDPSNVQVTTEGVADVVVVTAAGLSDVAAGVQQFNKNGSIATLKKISETNWLLFGDIVEGDSTGFPLN